jgi:hypothetical protein
MAKSDEQHEKKEHEAKHNRMLGRAFNTPANAMQSVATGRACISSLTPGKVWTKRGPHGEFELKGSLMLNDAAVIVLHFNPEDGGLLPKGLHAMSEGKPDAVSMVTALLAKIPGEISVLEGAEFREPESTWAVPVAHKGRIVGHLHVSSDGAAVLPDRKAAEELKKTGDYDR